MDRKAYIIALYNILCEKSDPDHPLSESQIRHYLETEYDIKCGIKKFYNGIHALETCFDISTYNENRKGYYLIERKLDKSEVLHLCHTVHATNSLTPYQIRDLEDRLLSLLSRTQRKQFRESVYLDNPKNSGSCEWLYNMDLLSEAIQKRRWIQFNYMHYNYEMNLIHRGDPYLREPRFIVFDRMHSYLIATDTRHDGASHFRIDRISDLKILNKCVSDGFDKSEAYDYASSKMFMFSGDSIRAEFLCKYTESIFDILIDEFGKDIKFTQLKNDPEHFKMTVCASYSGLVIFSQKYTDIMYPIFPRKLVADVTQRLSDTVAVLKNILG